MKAIVTVLGKDQIGTVAKVSTILMNFNVNIDDISQNVMQSIFNMAMIVDLSKMQQNFEELSNALSELGKEMNHEIRIQREEIFTAMHRI